jgi:GT2 family glycosyltransferase
MSSESQNQIVVFDNDVDKPEPEPFVQVGADHVLSSTDNRGFGGGVNAAVSLLADHSFEYIWLINNDATATQQSLAALLLTATKSRAAMVGSTIYYMDEPELLWCEYSRYHKPWYIVQNIGKKKRLTGEIRDREVNFVNGCSTLIRREVFEKLHGFDESLFLYAEDLDLCIKCSASGESLFACADSVVYHAVSSATGGEFNVRREFYIARNGYAMIMRYVNNPIVKAFAVVSRIPWDAYRFLRTALRSGKWAESVRFLVKSVIDGCLGRLGRLDEN